MKILVTGVKGQLGHDVCRELSHRNNHQFMGVDIEDFDITDLEGTKSFIMNYTPDAVIHCSAYTAVDKAEDEPELCYLVNETGTKNIALACKEVGAKLLYISTDYVFSGEGTEPYDTNDEPNPQNVYGKSKLAGEIALQQVLEEIFIVRISWVFGINGNNFVKTMLKLAGQPSQNAEGSTITESKKRGNAEGNSTSESANEGNEVASSTFEYSKMENENKKSNYMISPKTINVVSDQIGSPTYTADLAVLLCDMIETENYGIYHATNEGYCSWAEFAEEIFRIAGELNSNIEQDKKWKIEKDQKSELAEEQSNTKNQDKHVSAAVEKIIVNPIDTSQYPTKAKRPHNSRLSKTCLDQAGFQRLPHWKEALTRYLEEINQ